MKIHVDNDLSLQITITYLKDNLDMLRELRRPLKSRKKEDLKDYELRDLEDTTKDIKALKHVLEYLTGAEV